MDVDPPARSFKGWHGRGYLPHCDFPGLIQGVTFRLHDSVPSAVLAGWKAELDWKEHRTSLDPEGTWDRQRQELHRRVSAFEDTGAGCCYFRDPALAALMVSALQHFERERYQLFAWCVMPNHVHGLLAPLPTWGLGQIVQSWKRHSARQANLRLGHGEGAFWAPDYYDRFMRDEAHFLQAVEYIHQNPVKAGLCRKAGDWPWSSAYQRSADL